MSILHELVAPAVVCAAMAALLTPFLFFLLKRRDERKKRHFEVRYAEYKKCLQVLEEIAAVARIDFKQAYTGIVASTLKDALADADEDYSLRLEKGLADLGSRLRESFGNAARELHGLGLVCPGKLLGMINEFVKLQREILEESIAVMADASISNPSASVTGAMNEKAQRAQSLFDQILERMRSGLDVRL